MPLYLLCKTTRWPKNPRWPKNLIFVVRLTLMIVYKLNVDDGSGNPKLGMALRFPSLILLCNSEVADGFISFSEILWIPFKNSSIFLTISRLRFAHKTSQMVCKLKVANPSTISEQCVCKFEVADGFTIFSNLIISFKNGSLSSTDMKMLKEHSAKKFKKRWT